MMEVSPVLTHSLVPLVDLSRADLKVWIFSDQREVYDLEQDATYGEMKTYYSQVELTKVQDQKQLIYQIDQLKSSTSFEYDRVIQINNRKVILIVDECTCEFALKDTEYGQLFKAILLQAQFVFYLGCKQRLIKEIIAIQKEKDVKSISVINNLSDLVLC